MNDNENIIHQHLEDVAEAVEGNLQLSINRERVKNKKASQLRGQNRTAEKNPN